jgi:hypothetical protein
MCPAARKSKDMLIPSYNIIKDRWQEFFLRSFLTFLGKAVVKGEN